MYPSKINGTLVQGLVGGVDHVTPRLKRFFFQLCKSGSHRMKYYNYETIDTMLAVIFTAVGIDLYHTIDYFS